MQHCPPARGITIHEDRLGSTTAITDETGEPEIRDYLAFGDERTPIPWIDRGIMSGFTGQQHDPELGLINMKERLYDPRVGIGPPPSSQDK